MLRELPEDSKSLTKTLNEASVFLSCLEESLCLTGATPTAALLGQRTRAQPSPQLDSNTPEQANVKHHTQQQGHSTGTLTHSRWYTQIQTKAKGSVGQCLSLPLDKAPQEAVTHVTKQK